MQGRRVFLGLDELGREAFKLDLVLWLAGQMLSLHFMVIAECFLENPLLDLLMNIKVTGVIHLIHLQGILVANLLREVHLGTKVSALRVQAPDDAHFLFLEHLIFPSFLPLPFLYLFQFADFVIVANGIYDAALVHFGLVVSFVEVAYLG